MTTIAGAAPLRLADAVGTIPAACRRRSIVRGLGMLIWDLGVYAGAVALLASDEPWRLALGWPLAGIAIASLFVLGHDAAHGALFDDRRLCRLVGTLAMLPSLHAHAVWAYGHNRVHHTFTTCADLDAVWHPVSPDDWRSAAPGRRLLHRLEWSWLGAGPYYGRAIWWRQIVRAPAPRGQDAAFRRDRLIIVAWILLASIAATSWGLQEYGTTLGVAWSWTKLLLVPWLLWNVLIGWTVYLHHIHPAIPWARRGRWTKLRGQIEGTTELTMPAWIDFVSHNVFHHVAHHVDPRIPFYRLPEASRALKHRFGQRIRTQPYRLGQYRRTTRRCKLFDFDREEWLRYPRRSSHARFEASGDSDITKADRR